MKICSKCNIPQEESEFYKSKGGKNGLMAQCKTCTKKQVLNWNQSNREKTRVYVQTSKDKDREKVKAQSRDYYYRNRDKYASRRKKWCENNPDRVLQLRKEWAEKNPHYYTMTGRIRKKHINENCQPVWVDEKHLESIKELYTVAQALSKRGEKFHVDHISPLKGKNEKGEHVSSGLHVFWNLRVIPAVENLKKSNRLVV